MWQVTSLAVLSDNYIHIIHNEQSAIIIDPALSDEVESFVDRRDLSVKGILITHHHNDHIGGIGPLKERYKCPVYGLKKDCHRIAGLTNFVTEGSQMTIEDLSFEVWFTPGHTSGHLCFIEPVRQWLFCGDTLFIMGCGRVFDGSLEALHTSLLRLKSLPGETKI